MSENAALPRSPALSPSERLGVHKIISADGGESEVDDDSVVDSDRSSSAVDPAVLSATSSAQARLAQLSDSLKHSLADSAIQEQEEQLDDREFDEEEKELDETEDAISEEIADEEKQDRTQNSELSGLSENAYEPDSVELSNGNKGLESSSIPSFQLTANAGGIFDQASSAKEAQAPAESGSSTSAEEAVSQSQSGHFSTIADLTAAAAAPALDASLSVSSEGEAAARHDQFFGFRSSLQSFAAPSVLPPLPKDVITNPCSACKFLVQIGIAASRSVVADGCDGMHSV